MGKRLLSSLMLVVASAAHATDIDEKSPWLPNTDIDVLNYKILISVPEIALRDLDARVEIDFKSLSDLQYLKLHTDSRAIRIKSVSQNGRSLQYSFPTKGVLKIDFDQTMKKATTRTFTIDYTITSDQLDNRYKGLFYSPNVSGVPVISVQDWPYYTRLWVPSNDAPQDPATFQLEAHVPDGTVALSNGTMVMTGLDRAGLKVFKWKMEVPIPTYGLNLVIGDYRAYEKDLCFRLDTVNDEEVPCAADTERIPLRLYVPKTTQADQVWEQVQVNARSVIFYSSLLGKYPYSKIAFVSAPQQFNMEYPSLITGLGSQVHELAHHWWGDSVYIEHWGDFWISEGFTTFFAGLYREFKSGRIIERNVMNGRLAYPEDTDPNSIFDSTPYDKGATAVHKLRLKSLKLASLEPGSAEGVRLFYSLVRSIYGAHRLSHLGTESLIAYLKLNLKMVFTENGYNVEQRSIEDMVDDWANEMFATTWSHFVIHENGPKLTTH